MSQSLPLGLPLQGRAAEYASAKATSIPWTIWFMVGGLISGTIGGIWDISWHMSIGRDSFWTPAHIMIQLTGVLVGIACAYMILHTTFAGSSSERDASVQLESVVLSVSSGRPTSEFYAVNVHVALRRRQL